MGERILTALGLTKSFGALTAVDRMNLVLERGEIRALIGPNGAGKTTLLHLLGGQLRPDSGSIHLERDDVTWWPAHRRARRGLARTFQTPSLFPHLTVREHLEAALHGGRLRFRRHAHLRARIGELVRRYRLGGKEELTPRELSHGDCRLLELAAALALEPRLLLLDEPTGGLGDSATEALMETLGELHDVALLIVEHDMEAVFRLATTIMVMHQGRELAHGSPEEIRADPDVQQVYLGGSQSHA